MGPYAGSAAALTMSAAVDDSCMGSRSFSGSIVPFVWRYMDPAMFWLSLMVERKRADGLLAVVERAAAAMHGVLIWPCVCWAPDAIKIERGVCQ
jgi:hypothetical protein